MKTNQKTEKEKLDAQLKAILEMQPPKRWRAMADFARAINPLVRTEQDAQIEVVKGLRLEQTNKFGAGKSGLRHGVSIPQLTWMAIVSVDPELQDTDLVTTNRATQTNRLVRQLARVFPEYKVYEVI